MRPDRRPSWWLARLGAMSLPELVHRGWRVARAPLDVVRMRADRYVRPRRNLTKWSGPDPFYFPVDAAMTPISEQLREHADAICRGERDVLGLGRLTLPDAPWHVEPLAHVEWPRVISWRTLAAAPAGLDPRLTWEINRGHEWVVLACAYNRTRDPRYRDRLAHELASWLRNNPIGVGINWTSAMEVAIRIHSFAWAAAFLRGDASEILGTLARAIHEHIMFVVRNLSRFSSANNHLIVELSGLVVGARALADRDGLGRLRRRALAKLDEEVRRQVLADGVSAEMATHYHIFVLEALTLVARLERAHGEPRIGLELVLARMNEYLAAIRCGDGSVLQQGDSDNGEIVPACVRDPEPLPAPNTAMRSRHFTASGQVVLRSPRMLAILDAGPFGFGSLAAHAHCDALALALAIDGRRMLVDRGTYRYNGANPQRERFRSTAAHNTLQLGVREQADAAGPFLWSRRPNIIIDRCELGEEGDIVVARHDGFMPWRHRRTLVHRDGILLVIDDIEGPPTNDRSKCRYHFAPELEVAHHSHHGGTLCVASATDRGSIGRLWIASAARVYRMPHSEAYGSLTSAITVELETTTSALAVIGSDSMGDLAGLRGFAVARNLLPPNHVELPERI
jgi:uncharacterized heparinase superfamily protein